MAEEFWRREEPLLDDKGSVVRGGFWEHQRSWWELPNFIKALVTGYGSGKTLVASKRAIALALHNAPSPHLWVSPTYKMARRTAVPTIKALLAGKEQLTRGRLRYSYNKSEFEFVIRYGDRVGSIWVTSGEDPDSLKGPNIGSANIDEPFIQDREVFNQVLARTRDPLAKVHEIGLTGTPEDLNWGYDICEGTEKENFDIGVVHASTKANRALTFAYADRLERGLTERAAQAYVEGLFVSLSTGLVYYGFDEAVNVVDLPDPGHELNVGMDFNVNPMAAVVFWLNGTHMHVTAEHELPNADTEYMCQELRDTYGKRIQTVYPDASGRARRSSSPGGRSDFHIIRQFFEMDSPPFNPPRKDRYNAVNGKFRPRNGVTTLTISPKCKKLIHYLKAYSHAKMDKQQEMSHLLDALGYPTVRLFPIKMDTPAVVSLSGY